MSDSGSVLIVGTGPAAAAAAESYREHGGSGAVTMLGAEGRPSYERPLLSKDYLRREVGIEELFLHDPSWYEQNEIELRLGVGARSLELDTRRVIDETGVGWDFGTCLIATGARPAMPDIDGLDLQGVRFLRTIEDSDWLASNCEKGTSVLVVGSGFIGCEAAVSLSMRGAEVKVASLEAQPQVERLGQAASDRIVAWLAEAGVELIGGVSLEGIESSGLHLLAHFSGGGTEAIEADVILVSLGVTRNVDWTEGSGLAIEEGAIRVDQSMRSSGDGVFAAGDAAMAENTAAGRPLLVEHWGEALNHGEVAGAVMAGSDARWDTAPGFWSTIGERTLKQVAWGDGFDEARLEAHGDDAFTVWYERGGEVVGVLTHDRDEDYDEGRQLLEAGS